MTPLKYRFLRKVNSSRQSRRRFIPAQMITWLIMPLPKSVRDGSMLYVIPKWYYCLTVSFTFAYPKTAGHVVNRRQEDLWWSHHDSGKPPVSRRIVSHLACHRAAENRSQNQPGLRQSQWAGASGQYNQANRNSTSNRYSEESLLIARIVPSLDTTKKFVKMNKETHINTQLPISEAWLIAIGLSPLSFLLFKPITP